MHVVLGESLAGGERAAEALDFGDAFGFMITPRQPRLARSSTGPDQAERRGLAGERPITFVVRLTSTKVRSSRFVDRNPLAVLGGEAQVHDERVEVVFEPEGDTASLPSIPGTVDLVRLQVAAASD